VIGRKPEVYCRSALDVTGGSGAVEVGMETWLVLLLVMSQGAEQGTGKEHQLACTAARDVTGASGGVQVGMDMWLVQVLL